MSPRMLSLKDRSADLIRGIFSRLLRRDRTVYHEVPQTEASSAEATWVRRSAATRGARNPRARLTDEQVRFIRQSHELGTVLAKSFGVSKGQISAIKRGKAWKSLS